MHHRPIQYTPTYLFKSHPNWPPKLRNSFAPSPFPPSCLFIIKRRFFSVYMHTAAALYFLKPKSINPFNNMTWVWWRAVTELFPHINQNLLDINYNLAENISGNILSAKLSWYLLLVKVLQQSGFLYVRNISLIKRSFCLYSSYCFCCYLLFLHLLVLHLVDSHLLFSKSFFFILLFIILLFFIIVPIIVFLHLVYFFCFFFSYLDVRLVLHLVVLYFVVLHLIVLQHLVLLVGVLHL